MGQSRESGSFTGEILDRRMMNIEYNPIRNRPLLQRTEPWNICAIPKGHHGVDVLNWRKIVGERKR